VVPTAAYQIIMQLMNCDGIISVTQSSPDLQPLNQDNTASYSAAYQIIMQLMNCDGIISVTQSSPDLQPLNQDNTASYSDERRPSIHQGPDLQNILRFIVRLS